MRAVNEAKAALQVAAATSTCPTSGGRASEARHCKCTHDETLAEALAAQLRPSRTKPKENSSEKHNCQHGNCSGARFKPSSRSTDTGAADLRAVIEQVNIKSEAIEIAEADLRMAEANLENAEAVIEQKQSGRRQQAELDLKRTVLRSPIDGVIVKRDVNPGQTVAVALEAKTLFTIANNLDSMEVHGKIDEADIGKLRVGQSARFTIDAYPDRTFTGKVLQIRKASEVVQNVVTYTAIISAPNPELLLLPGMTAELRVVISDTGNVLKIPNQALHFRPEVTGVAFEPQAQQQLHLPQAR